ncbi:MAG: HesA/MoeB/ThiF family protein [Urechidicola sp.]|nr:HesA/MoeB/ThiF family protein [Urechidicola sp.]
MTDISSKQLFQRQTTLSELGKSGQQKLQQAKVTVVGCGGLGSVAAIYLAGSGIGNIHLVDFDVVDVSNLHRQVFYKIEDIGKLKAEVLAKYIQSISPFVKVTFSADAISKSNVVDAIATSEIVLDCTDNLPIKYLLNDVCVLHDKVLVYGSLYKFDGYVSTFNMVQENGKISANLRDTFPEIPTEHIPNCSELGTLNTIVGIIGLMQANEVLKLVAGIGKPLINQLLIYNSLENSQFVMQLKPKVDKEKIKAIFEIEPYEAEICEIDESLEISQSDFKKALENNISKLKIILVTEDVNQEIPFQVSEKIPLSIFQNWINKQETLNNEIVIICQRGVMSLTAVKMLKEKFSQANVKSLKEGIIAF